MLRRMLEWTACCAVCLLMQGAAGAEDAPKAAVVTAADAGWITLAPATGLEAWAADKPESLKYWAIIDGVIVGENTDKKGSVLWTASDYGDYEIIVEYQTPSADYDSGIFLRGESHQAQIGVSRSLKVDLTGCLYCPKDGNKDKYPQQPRGKVKGAHKLGEWNTLRVVTNGSRITTYLNDVQINDYEGIHYPAEGKIGLQLHQGVHQKMLFRVVKIKPLD